MSASRPALVAILAAALLLAGNTPAAIGQDASAAAAADSTSALVEVPVPVRPRTPSQEPPDPAATAEAWLAATSDEQRRDILLDVLAGIGIGVYTGDGEPILFGAEKDIDDPWLLDTEVALLSADPDEQLRVSIADLAVTLKGLVESGTGEPLTPEAISGYVTAGMTEAMSDRAEPSGFPLRLARELVLRETGTDLAEGVPVDVGFGSLASTLIAWDLLWPLLAGEPVAFALVSATMPRQSASEPLRVRERARVTAASRTAQACDRIASWATSESWSIGRSGARAVADGLRMIGQLPPTQVLHMLALAYAIRVSSEMGGPIDWHYHHPDDGEPPVRPLTVRVSMVEDLPAMNGACAAMLGLILPPRGPVAGATVTWSTGLLKDHGTISCPETCTRTDAGGFAVLGFQPNTEPDPAGLGPEKHDRALVSAHVDYLLPLGNVYGNLPFSGEYRFSDVGISWHQPYRFVLAVDSDIKGTALMRFKAQAKGTIELADPPSELAIGRLRTTTRPQNADGCRSQTSAKGSGSVDLDAHSVFVDPEGRRVLASIDSGPEEEHPDTVTFKGCGPAKRFTKRMSIWELHFLMSHVGDMEPGEGLQLDGWRWVATDDTWEQGGTIATLDTIETCQGQCDGKTRFELRAYPKDDESRDQSDLPPVPPLPPLPGSPDGANDSSEHDEED